MNGANEIHVLSHLNSGTSPSPVRETGGKKSGGERRGEKQTNKQINNNKKKNTKGGIQVFRVNE